MICFGSFINGFSLGNSDVDCSILTNNYLDERQLLSYFYTAFQSVRPLDFQFLLLNSKVIRIPLIKIHSDELGEMDFAINNVLGVANSKLLKNYAETSKKCQILGKLVKIWGKNHRLIGPSALSSYAMVLLVIYFLQLKKILPSLQSIAKKKRLKNKTVAPILKVKRKVKNYEVEEFDTIIEFENDPKEIQKYMKENNYPVNSQGVFQLLLEFFKFYRGNGIFSKLGLRCNIKKGRVDFKRTTEENACLYSIVDPFDSAHNPGVRLKKDLHMADCDRMLITIDNTIRFLEQGDIRSAFNIK